MVTTQSIITLISQANRKMLISVIKLLHYTMEDKAHLINKKIRTQNKSVNLGVNMEGRVTSPRVTSPVGHIPHCPVFTFKTQTNDTVF